MDTSKMDVDEAAVSMYLSFDSTLSTSAYKTFEATRFSIDPGADAEFVDRNNTVNDDSRELHMESTLEADSTLPEQLQTAKKAGEMPLQLVGALPKNVLANYNAMCSTPAKSESTFKAESNMQYVETERSFGEAFEFLHLDEDEKDNKENVQPVTNDGSTMSMTDSSQVIKTPVKAETLKVIDGTKPLPVGKDNYKEPETKQLKLAEVQIRARTPNKNLSLHVKPGVKSSKNTSTELKTAEIVPPVLPKPKPNIQTVKNSRKSVCEPDLKTNRPSRIVPKGRQSVMGPNNVKAMISPTTSSLGASSSKGTVPLTTSSLISGTSKGLIPFTNAAVGPSTSKDTVSLSAAQAVLPQLLNKLAKVTFKEKTPIEAVKAKPEASAAAIFVPPVKNLHVGHKRKSMLPMVSAEKRHGFTQRMSIVVKTTLNSPARKIPRKSVLPTNFGQRKSVLPLKTDPKPNSNFASSRKSIMPPHSSVATNSGATAAAAIGPKASHLPTRQSMLPHTGAVPKITVSKPQTESYACNVCSVTFRIKSLLDAHKRSHEDGGTPTYVRKTKSASTDSAATNSLMNTFNKCKYCDKKFALLRALHIHLLQNCPKIPPADKRKLEYTEMDHVEKAQLPHVFNASHTGAVSKANSNIGASGVSSKMPQKSLSNLGSYTALVSSKPASLEQKDAPKRFDKTDGLDMPPPQNRTLSTKSNGQPSGHPKNAIRGVFRTPKKAITCYICKTQFKTVMEYTNHSLKMHSSNN